MLLTAAALKGYAMSTGPLIDMGLWANRPFMTAAVSFEALLGLWLIGGVWSRQAGRIALVLFGLFAALSLLKGLKGAGSCGCFGRVAVNPWITFGVDLAALPAAWTITRYSQCSRPRYLWKRLAAMALLSVVVGMPGLYRMLSYDEERPDQELVILDPAQWVGRSWPLMRYADVAPQLAKGDWIVLLYSYPCGHCFDTIREYAELADHWERRGGPARVALLNTSDEAPPEGQRIEETAALQGKLDAPAQWFIASPTLVLMRDGRVVTTAEGEDDCRWESGKFNQ